MTKNLSANPEGFFVVQSLRLNCSLNGNSTDGVTIIRSHRHRLSRYVGQRVAAILFEGLPSAGQSADKNGVVGFITADTPKPATQVHQVFVTPLR